jgi:hypothetical protein
VHVDILRRLFPTQTMRNRHFCRKKVDGSCSAVSEAATVDLAADRNIPGERVVFNRDVVALDLASIVRRALPAGIARHVKDSNVAARERGGGQRCRAPARLGTVLVQVAASVLSSVACVSGQYTLRRPMPAPNVDGDECPASIIGERRSDRALESASVWPRYPCACPITSVAEVGAGKASKSPFVAPLGSTSP